MRIFRPLLVSLLLAGWAPGQTTPNTTSTNTAVEARRALDLLLSGHYSEFRALFTDQLRTSIPEETLRDKVGPGMKALGELKSIQGPRVFAGKMGSDTVFQINFSSGVLGVLLSLDKEGHIGGLQIRRAEPNAAKVNWTSAEYSHANSFRVLTVTVGGGAWKLPATLLMPNGAGPFPAVVLAHGSPQYDRDENVETNKPFRDIAEGLASNGVAVLRYETRQRVYPKETAAIRGLTVQQEVVDDAVYALALVRSQPKVDAKRVYFLGHNVAAYVAPRVAAADGHMTGVILLAANVTPLPDLLVEQAERAGLPAAQVQQLKGEAGKVKALHSAATGQAVLNEPASYWLDLEAYNPAEAAKALPSRLLILQGGRDFQSAPKEFEAWKQALAGKPNVTFHEYPALNHLFISGQGKSTLEEYRIPGHVAPKVIDDIAAWVKQ